MSVHPQDLNKYIYILLNFSLKNNYIIENEKGKFSVLENLLNVGTG